jgi:hypothetical protein
LGEDSREENAVFVRRRRRRTQTCIVKVFRNEKVERTSLFVGKGG